MDINHLLKIMCFCYYFGSKITSDVFSTSSSVSNCRRSTAALEIYQENTLKIVQESSPPHSGLLQASRRNGLSCFGSFVGGPSQTQSCTSDDCLSTGPKLPHKYENEVQMLRPVRPEDFVELGVVLHFIDFAVIKICFDEVAEV